MSFNLGGSKQGPWGGNNQDPGQRRSDGTGNQPNDKIPLDKADKGHSVMPIQRKQVHLTSTFEVCRTDFHFTAPETKKPRKESWSAWAENLWRKR